MITDSMILAAIKQLDEANVPPDIYGNYHFLVPITPMYEQKLNDFAGHGINDYEDWFHA